ncbi:MAG: thioredoxin family protein [Bacteroidetes bacterium]|nr:MAG: thioredoxin family protein [Bacteroidota bacterium]
MKQNDKTYSRIFAIAFLAVTVFAFILYFVPERQPLNWLSYDDALIVAAKKNKPVLLNFYSIWSEDCKRLDRDVFSNDSLKNMLKSKYILARIILDNKQNSKIAKEQFDIKGIPALVELSPKGKEIRRFPGADARLLYLWMTDTTYKIIDSWLNFNDAKNEANNNGKILLVFLNTSFNQQNYIANVLNDDRIRLLIAQDYIPTYLVASNKQDRNIIKSLFGSFDSAPFGQLLMFYYKGKQLEQYYLTEEMYFKKDVVYNKMLDVIKQKDSK